MIEGLERVISGAIANSGLHQEAMDAQFFEKDSYGVPVLKRRGVTVSDSLIEKMREQEGV